MLDLSLSATTVLDSEAQKNKAVSEVIRILGAERGYLFLLDEKTQELMLSVGLNKDGASIDSKAISRTVLDEVVRRKAPVIVTGDETGDIVGSKSISVYQLRSIMAAPLMVGERVLGVLYLDNQLAKGVFHRRDMDVFQAIGAQVVLSLEMSRAAKSELERRELARDLELIGFVQNLLLPRKSFLSGSASELAAHYQPASTSGGDWWWFDQKENGDFVAILGDVTGHGAGPAMVTALLTGSFNGLFEDKPYFSSDTELVTKRLKKLHEMFREFCRGEYWMTLSLMKYEASTKKVSYWNLGGPPLLILEPKESKAQSLLPRGMPLGAEEILIGFETVTVPSGTRLGMMTDGVYEMLLPSTKELGLRGLSKLLLETRELSTEKARDRIAERLTELRGPVSLRDDLALLLIGTK